MAEDKSVLSVLNPLDSEPWAPKGFKPFGGSRDADKYNRKTFQTLALIPMAFVVGAAIRRMGGQTSEELKKLDKTGPLALAMTSPVLKNEDYAGKRAADPLYGTLSITAPILAAYAAMFYGMKAADRHMENSLNRKYDDQIALKEKEYNDILSSKIYPHKAATKKASALFDVMDAVGLLKWVAPIMLTIGVGSGIASYNYANANDENRAKAKQLAKSLELRARQRWVPKVNLPDDPNSLKDTTI